MSSRMSRRDFLGRTITTTLGAGVLVMLDTACAPVARPSPLGLMPAPEVNSACSMPPPERGVWRIAAPPSGTFYHGVYPGHCEQPDQCKAPGDETGEEDNITPADLLSYSSNEHGVGEDVPIAWVYFSNNWGRTEPFSGELFPMDTANWIHDRKGVPFIRLMLRKDTTTEECKGSKVHEDKYTLEKLHAGCFDDKLRAWGRAAQTFGHPLIVEWGTEVNGCWFHWNGKWHGRESGASLFRNAFRRIVRIIRDEAGARNITWVFHATAAGDPDWTVSGNEWNRICRYYPGDDFVDWIGLSVYGADAPLRNSPCVSFEKRMEKAMVELGDLKRRKPLFILEFGAPAGHPGCDVGDETCEPKQCDTAQWADDALRHLLSNRWPEVRGFSWWNEVWEGEDEDEKGKKKKFVMNMRVQTVSGLKEKFSGRLHQTPGLISCPTYQRIEARDTQLKMLVPAYFFPGGGSAKQWDALIEAANEVELVAIANPQNGPGKKSSDDYKHYIQQAVAHGATVIGYVSTDYGRIPLKKIKEDVHKWLDWYSPIGGFFFDEQWPDDKNAQGVDMIAHYHAIFDYAREQLSKKTCGSGLIISNPGTVCSVRYLTEAGADVLCLYESAERSEETGGKTFRDFIPPPWMKAQPSRHFASLMLQVASAEIMGEYLRKATTDGFGYVYMTERSPRDPAGKYCRECQADKTVTPQCEEDCNPWNRLAAYWQKEVESISGSSARPLCQ